MISRTETIDFNNPLCDRIFANLVDDWRRDCIKKVCSKKSVKLGGRLLRREIDRKECKVESNDEGSIVTLTFKSKDKVIGELKVTIENFEPEPIQAN